MWSQIKQHPKAVLVALFIHLFLLAFFVINVGSRHEEPATASAIQAEMSADPRKVAEIKEQMKALPEPTRPDPEEDKKKAEEQKEKQKEVEEAKRLETLRREQVAEKRRIAEEEQQKLEKKREIEKQKREKRKKDELQKQQQLKEEKRLAEIKKKKTEEKKREKEKAEAQEKAAAEEALKKEEKRKAKAKAEKQRKAEKEKERLAEEKRKKEERRVREEKAAQRDKILEDAQAEKSRLAEALAAEEQMFQSQAEEKARVGSLRAQYIGAIKGRVQSRWLQPIDGVSGKCDVYVRQSPSGRVLDVKVQSSSTCNAEMKQSVEKAVRRADPLPAPPDRKVFDPEINFVFEPQT